ncbi:MAG: ATP-binding protein [Opitutaceae bacterium]
MVSRNDLAIDWAPRSASTIREFAEVLAVVATVTIAGWFAPVSYRALGHIYLLAVIALGLRVGRWPVISAAIISAVAWNYVIVPPRLSFSVLDFEDAMMLGTYFVVALITGQLTTRIRAEERYERGRERRSRALFHLTRALASAQSLDEALVAALRQADEIFNARTAVLLLHENGILVRHPASTYQMSQAENAAANWSWSHAQESGRFTPGSSALASWHVPMLRADVPLGVFVIRLSDEVVEIAPAQRELVEAFAAQIALLIEREHLRAASEREKLLVESDRLHRTLLDSVSHELKTPLAVLRSAAESLSTEDGNRRARLAGEIRTATRRLDHLVANLLNQTRLESGAVKPQLDWCDARDLINAARRTVGSSLAGRPFEIAIPHDMPLFQADAPLMEQVISNLLLNVALHTPDARPVFVTGGVDAPRKRVFIAIADRGPGIPPELRNHLFQKFRRGSSAHTGGLGLGLSIVRGFMLAQGGEVVGDDHPGGGARFTVYLPYKEHGGVPRG